MDFQSLNAPNGDYCISTKSSKISFYLSNMFLKLSSNYNNDKIWITHKKHFDKLCKNKKESTGGQMAMPPILNIKSTADKHLMKP